MNELIKSKENKTEINSIFINEYPETFHITSWDYIVDFIRSLTKENYFYLVILFIVIFIVCKKSYIISILIFSIFIIFLIFYKNKVNAINDTKRSILYPKSKYIEEVPELYNFFFSIQEFYEYNPSNYTKIIINIDKILSIYKDIQTDNNLAGQYYDALKDLKYDTLSLFQGFIHKLPDDKNVVEKYNTAKFELEKILDKYTDEAFKINREYIKNNGINYTTKFLSDEKLKHPYNEAWGNTEKIISSIDKII